MQTVPHGLAAAFLSSLSASELPKTSEAGPSEQQKARRLGRGCPQGPLG